MSTIQINKGLSVPYAFTLGALEAFCEETNTPLSDIYAPLTAPKGQLFAAQTLLYHIVCAGFEDLGEKCPYTKEEVFTWFTGKKNPVNLILLNAVIALAAKALLTVDEEETETVVAEKN